MEFEEQRGEVVDRHHVRPDHEQPHAIQGNMHQVGRQAAKERGESDVVQRVPVGKVVDGGAEVCGQPGERSRLGRSAYQRVAIARVDATQRVHQAADVGAYPEIANAAPVSATELIVRVVLPEDVRVSV